MLTSSASGRSKLDRRRGRIAQKAIRVAGAGALTSLAAFAALSLARKRPAQLPFPDGEPTNPNATPEARGLLRKICEISGRFTLTGQQNFPEDLSRYSDRMVDLTGKYPAIFGQDFGFASEANQRASMIEEAKRQHRDGSIIALTWHAASPKADRLLTYEESVQGKLTDLEWDELLTPGTNLCNRWVEQVDAIAEHLRQLQTARVPVLFRPYHEINGQWFWWAGRLGERGSAALYRRLYDRYVNVNQLNNVLWVWNVSSPGAYAGPIEPYYPGPRCVDVVTLDNYGKFKRRYYGDMLALAGNKPIGLAEVGAMPTLDVLAQQPRWAYFMIWRGHAEEANSPSQLLITFNAPNVLNRGDMSSELA
jgi:mannan endo-1,4-beta-mannosidase